MSEQKEDIYSIMGWYGNLEMNYRDIETLIYKRRLLIGMYGELAKHYKKELKEYHAKHPDRRIKEAKKLMHVLDAVDPPTLGKAAATALIEVEQEYRTAYELKGETEGLKIIKEAVDNCLSAMLQDIADLRNMLGSNERTAADNS